MKILFVTHNGVSHEPLGLEYLSAALINSGHKTKACQQSKTIETCRSWLPDFVAFQVLTGDQDRWGCTAKEIKQKFPGIKTIFGGPHFLFFSKIEQSEADYIIRGDGERAIVDVVEGRPFLNLEAVSDLDLLPHPDRALLYNEDFPGVKSNVIRNEIATRGCPYACTYCFTENTYINSINSFLDIKDIVENEESIKIYNANGEVSEVSQFHKRFYAGDFVSVKMHKICIPIEGTPNHEIFTEDGEKPLSEIKRGDWLRVAIPKHASIVPFIIPRLAGYYIAEGSACRSRHKRQVRFSFNSNERSYIEETKVFSKQQFEISAREVTQGSVTHVEMTRDFVYQFLTKNMGKGSLGKYIPAEVFGWTPLEKLEFLKGWFDGDGYKAQGRLVTVSPNLALQGFLLALSIGMKPSLYVRNIKDSKIGDRTISTKNKCWDIAFNFENDLIRLGCKLRKNKRLYKRRDDYFVRFENGNAYFKVKECYKKWHEGYVYNLGVENDHSYTANLVSVSNCYNSNKEWQKMVRGKRLRYHSPEWICEDISRTFSNHGGQLVSFQDDIFGIDIEWLEKFSKLYRKIGIPFFAQLRPHLITEDRVKLLKEAGIHIASFAIESGNEKTRTEILDRKESNDLIKKGCDLLHHYDIKFRMQNLLGLPVDDPLADALETLRFNISMRPTLSWCSLLQAYPGTEIANFVVKKGIVKSHEELMPLVEATFFDESSLPIKDKRKIERLQKYWSAVVRWPWLYPIVRFLINFDFGKKFHNFIFDAAKQYINSKEYWRVDNRFVRHLSLQNYDRLGGELERNVEKEQAACVS